MKKEIQYDWNRTFNSEIHTILSSLNSANQENSVRSLKMFIVGGDHFREKICGFISYMRCFYVNLCVSLYLSKFSSGFFIPSEQYVSIQFCIFPPENSVNYSMNNSASYDLFLENKVLLRYCDISITLESILQTPKVC